MPRFCLRAFSHSDFSSYEIQPGRDAIAELLGVEEHYEGSRRTVTATVICAAALVSGHVKASMGFGRR